MLFSAMFFQETYPQRRRTPHMCLAFVLGRTFDYLIPEGRSFTYIELFFSVALVCRYPMLGLIVPPGLE